jgi:Uma2 family endonuclease
MTSAEFAEITEDGRFDLVDGEVWPLAPARMPHGEFVADLNTELSLYARAHSAGKVYSGEQGFELDETGRTVLCPDVAFVTAQRLPAPRTEGFFPGAPDLAVEVVSESERPRLVLTKVVRYLSAGCRLVWCIYPKKRQVVVYSDNEPPQFLGVDDTLDGRDVLPGFQLPLAKLFEGP